MLCERYGSCCEAISAGGCERQLTDEADTCLFCARSHASVGHVVVITVTFLDGCLFSLMILVLFSDLQKSLISRTKE
jgi:hypothetical protein